MVGLIRRADGRYCAYANRNKTFGKDREEAIRRFLTWQSRRRGETITIVEPLTNLAQFEPAIRGGHEVVTGPNGLLLDGATINKRVQDVAFWATVTKLIREKPKLVARKTGIEELSYLSDLAPPQPSASLVAIGERYFTDKSTMSPDELNCSRTWWNEFIRITGARTVSDLSHDAFRKYREQIKANQRIPITRNGKTAPKSNSYTRSRFGKIATIINHALRELDLSPRDRETLALKILLKKPPKPKSNPIDLSIEEMTAILDHADGFDTALILTALNCNFYPIDCARLRWSMMDLDKGVLCFDRKKSEHLTDSAIVRVAVLWQRTIDALRRIRNENGGDDAYVFTFDGTMMEPQTPNVRFKRLLTRARIKRKLTFGHLRDSGQTRAAEAGVPMQEYRVLAGHRIGGVDDDYIRRNPMFVKNACAAIESYYFPKKPRSKE